MKKFTLSALVGAAALLASAGAFAQVSDTFDVTLTVSQACSITAAPGNIAINYVASTAAPAVTGNTTFGVTCTNTVPYSLGLDAPGGIGATTSLAYNLALSNASGGDASAAVQTLPGTGTGAAQTYYIYATALGNQLATTGTDTITHTVTVTY